MRNPLPVFLLSTAFAASSALGLTAQSPGFSCAKATTPQEKTICASPVLRKADAEMTAAYKAWLTAAPAAWKPQIRQNQRLWLQLRPGNCTDKDPKERADCLLSAEQDRTKTLQGMVTRKNGILFLWQALTFTAPDSPDIAKDEVKDSQRAFGYVDATWPQAQSSAPEWQAWNKAISAQARMTNQPDGGQGVLNKQSAVDADTNVSITLNVATDQLASASIHSYWYGHGAAHGLSSISQFNWLLKEKRELKAADLFRPQIYWSNELYKRTDQYLHQKLDSNSQSYETFAQPGEMKKTVQKLVADPHRWQIDKNGISIPFEPYEVACYACTPEPFTMSWDSLKPLLNPAFQIPR